MRGFIEEGTTTTPFDMVMLNDLDRYHLVIDVLDRVPGLAEREAALRQDMQDARLRARNYTRQFGEDIPEVAEWAWGGRQSPPGSTRRVATTPETDGQRTTGRSAVTTGVAPVSSSGSSSGRRLK